LTLQADFKQEEDMGTNFTKLGAASVLASLLVMFNGATVYAKDITLGFVATNQQNPAEVSQIKGFKKTAESLGAKVVILDAKGSVEKMSNAVDDLIAQRVNGIALIPLDGVVAQHWVEEAKTAGVPFVSDAVQVGDPNKRAFKEVYPGLSALVGQDYVDSGYRMAQAAAKLLPPGHVAKIGIVEGQAGYALVKQLNDGFNAGLKAAGVKYDIVMAQPTDWTPAKGESVCQNALVANPDIDLFFSQAEDMAIGCAKAISAAGSKAKLVTVAGGSKLGSPLIQSGAITISMCEKWENTGSLTAKALYDAATNPSTPKARLIAYQPELITSTNLKASCSPPQW
jgi:ribose transport system substrate-binding protein